MWTDSKKMTDASFWGPKRPQECLLGLSSNSTEMQLSNDHNIPVVIDRNQLHMRDYLHKPHDYRHTIHWLAMIMFPSKDQ